jgi:hypothetical protein
MCSCAERAVNNVAVRTSFAVTCHNNRMNSTAYAKASSSDKAAVGNGNGADKSPEHMLRSKILAKVPQSIPYMIDAYAHTVYTVCICAGFCCCATQC